MLAKSSGSIARGLRAGYSTENDHLHSIEKHLFDEIFGGEICTRNFASQLFTHKTHTQMYKKKNMIGGGRLSRRRRRQRLQRRGTGKESKHNFEREFKIHYLLHVEMRKKSDKSHY